MKLATLHDGSRDGQLVVVSRDLASAHLASHIAGTLRQVMDDWNFLSPQLEDLYATLNGGKARHAFPFDSRACLAPLPRAWLWAPQRAAAGGAPARVAGHVDAVAAAAGLQASAADAVSGRPDGLVPPLLARSDVFSRPGAPAPAMWGATAWLQLQPAVLTGDVAAGADADTALDGVRLLLLAATWWDERGVAGTAFAPVACTPDEAGRAWHGGRLSLPLLPGPQGAAVPAGPAPAVGQDFGPVLAALARQQGLAAGSLVGGPAVVVWPQGELENETGRHPPAGPGAPLQVQVQVQVLGSDGASLFGLLDLPTPAPAPAPVPLPADDATPTAAMSHAADPPAP